MARKRLAPARPLKRPYRPREPKKRFLIFCEGAVTERSYFLDFRSLLRSPLIEVEVAPEHGCDPKSLVELAKERREQAKLQARRHADENLLYDEVWCVFDVDDHTRLRDALQQAKACSIPVAVSNPCFELWILLHFADRWAYIERRDLRASVRGYMPAYDKKAEFALLKDNTHSAIKRAKEMERRAAELGNPFDNPTTGVWRLVCRLCREANFSIACL
jgi:hypothetical protein